MPARHPLASPPRCAAPPPRLAPPDQGRRCQVRRRTPLRAQVNPLQAGPQLPRPRCRCRCRRAAPRGWRLSWRRACPTCTGHPCHPGPGCGARLHGVGRGAGHVASTPLTRACAGGRGNTVRARAHTCGDLDDAVPRQGCDWPPLSLAGDARARECVPVLIPAAREHRAAGAQRQLVAPAGGGGGRAGVGRSRRAAVAGPSARSGGRVRPRCQRVPPPGDGWGGAVGCEMQPAHELPIHQAPGQCGRRHGAWSAGSGTAAGAGGAQAGAVREGSTPVALPQRITTTLALPCCPRLLPWACLRQGNAGILNTRSTVSPLKLGRSPGSWQLSLRNAAQRRVVCAQHVIQ